MEQARILGLLPRYFLAPRLAAAHPLQLEEQQAARMTGSPFEQNGKVEQSVASEEVYQPHNILVTGGAGKGWAPDRGET